MFSTIPLCLAMSLWGAAAGNFADILIKMHRKGYSFSGCAECWPGSGLQTAIMRTALSFAFISASFFNTAEYGISTKCAAVSFAIPFLSIAAVIDIETGIIPNALILAGMLAAAPIAAYDAFTGTGGVYGGMEWWEHPAGAVFIPAALIAARYAGNKLRSGTESVGMGDIKLFVPLGLFFGLRMTLFILLSASVSAGACGMLVCLGGALLNKPGLRSCLKTSVPFAPFIAAGFMVSLLFGQDMIDWYM